MTALALVPSRRRVTVRRPAPRLPVSAAKPTAIRSSSARRRRIGRRWPGGSAPAFAALLILSVIALAPPAAVVALILRITGVL